MGHFGFQEIVFVVALLLEIGIPVALIIWLYLTYKTGKLNRQRITRLETKVQELEAKQK